MSRISRWISENYDILKIKTKGINTKEPDDVFNEVMVQFLEMDTGKTSLLINNNEADRYIMAMYKVNCFSRTSPYQRTYNKYSSVEFDENKYEELYDINTDMCIRDFELMLDQVDMFFVHKAVFKDYIYRKMKKKGFSINKISIESEIPKPTLDTKFKKIKQELKKLNNEDDEL